MDNFDKLMFTMLFVLHRTEELADCVVKLHNKMYNIELAQPYRTRFVNLISKYCKLIKLELVHIATLYQYTEGFNNYNKKHKNNIEQLISELTEKVEKSHKKVVCWLLVRLRVSRVLLVMKAFCGGRKKLSK